MAFDAGSVITVLGGKFDSAAFQRFDAANKKSAAAADAAEARITASQARISGSAGRMAQAQERTALATRSSTLALSTQSAALARTESDMARLEKTIRDSGVATKLQAAEMDRLTKQHTLLSSAMKDTSDKTTLFSRNSAQATKNLETLGTVGVKTAVVGLLSLAGATAYAVKTAGDFEKQMRNVNSIAKLPEAAYRNLSQSVLDLAGETAQAPKVLAEGLYSLVSSGFDANDSLTILKASAYAATAGLTTTATSSKVVAAALNAYREPASDASKVSDVLFETVNRGVLNFEELASSIGDVLPLAASLGVTLPEVGAAVSTMTKEGISAPESMTRLKRVIQSFIKPSQEMTAAIKETGAASGEQLVKQKGLEGAIEAVIKTTDGSKASIAKLFPDIRAFGGAIALTGKNSRAAAGDLKAFQDTAGATKRVFEEQAKGTEFAGKELVTSLESSAIAIGDKFLPIVGKGARELAQTLQQAAKDGTLQHVADDGLKAFENIGRTVGDLAPPLEKTAGALLDVGKALGLTNPDEVAALAAGFLAFKGVALVTPILLTGAGALKLLWEAVAEGGLSAIPEAAGLVALENPVTAIATAAALAAGAFLLLSGREESEAEAAKKVTEAAREEAAAITAVNEAVLAEADATFAAHKADDSLKQAKEHLSDVAKRYGKDSDQYRHALNQEREVALEDTAAHESLTKSHEETTAADKKADEQSKAHLKSAKELFQTEFQGLTNKVGHGEITGAEFKSGLIASLEKYNAAAQNAAKGSAVAALSAIQLDHVLEGQPLLAASAATSVVKLTDVWNKLSESQQKQLAGEPQQTLEELGNLTGQLHGVTVHQKVQLIVDAKDGQAQIAALRAVLSGVPVEKVIDIETNARTAAEQVAALNAVAHGVPASRVLAIETNADSTKDKIDELKDAVASVRGKTVPFGTNAPAVASEVSEIQAAVDRLHGTQIAINLIETTTKLVNSVKARASGRRPEGSETALVGEGNAPEWVVNSQTGAGFKVSAPTLLGLHASDYVIPTDKKLSGRALGLYAMLGRDLGVPGYSGGKHGKRGNGHKAMPVPDAVKPMSLPLTELESEQQKAKSRDERSEANLKKLATGKHGKKDVAAAKEKHARDARKLAEWDKAVKDAKAYQAQLDKANLQVSNARDAMSLAAGKGDEAAYGSAKAQRLKALTHVEQLVQGAQRQIGKKRLGSKWALELTSQLQTAQLEAQTTESESQPEEELTPAQQTTLKHLEENVALAALTPGLSDDTSAAQGLAGFLEGALAQAQQTGRGPEVIKELADQVAQARSNLSSLTGGGGSNENADVQAQLTQANERTQVAEQQRQTAERALQVFGGSGDIGSGGRNAVQSVTNNFSVMHMGTPAVQAQMADMVVAGLGYQGGRPNPRVRVGP
jgi:TP901 family phage tail tape measure protein